MNFYEELGVRPDASAEEIRAAYRWLAKLMHPDQQRDEQLREAAERQMRRLNEMIGLLTDERSRAAYDRSLAMAHLAAGSAREGRFAGAARHLARQWHIALITLAGFIFLILRFANPPDPEPAPRLASPVPEPPPRVEAATIKPPVELRSQKRPLAKERDSHRSRELPKSVKPSKPDEKPTPELTPAIVTQSLPLAPPSFPPPERYQAAAPPVEPPPARKSSGLLGTWLFVPGEDSAKSKLRFQPSYIELVVTDEQPQVRGRYRGRYREPTSALRPEVSFTLQGRGDGVFQWSALNGVKGEGRLKLLTAESLEINWWTTFAPQEPTLVSGAAVLVKLRAR